MRTSLRYGLGAVIVLVAGVAGALPWVHGQRAETAVREGVGALQARLAADPRTPAELSLLRYDRGAYGAEAVTRLRLPASEAGDELRAALGLPPGPTHIDLRYTLEHGLTGVDIRGELVADDLVGALLERLGGDAGSLRVDGYVGLQERRLEIALQRLQGALDADGRSRVRIEPLTASARYHSGSGEGRGSADWGGLSVDVGQGGTEGAEIGRVEVEAAGRLIAGSLANGLWAGESRVSIEHVSVREPGGGAGVLRDVRLETTTRQTGPAHMAGALAWRFGELRAPDIALDSGELALAAERLALAPLLALNRAGSAGAPLPGRAEIAGLLEAGPTLRLERLALRGPAGGSLTASGRLAVAPEAAEAAGAVLAGGGQALLRHVDGELALRVDRALAGNLPPSVAGFLGQLQAFGVLVAEGDQARLDAALADGRLTVNGNTWPLF